MKLLSCTWRTPIPTASDKYAVFTLVPPRLASALWSASKQTIIQTRHDQYQCLKFRGIGPGPPSTMRNSRGNLNALDIGAGRVIYQTLPARTWNAPPLFDVSVWLLVSAPVAACRAPAWSHRTFKQSLCKSSTEEPLRPVKAFLILFRVGVKTLPS